MYEIEASRPNFSHEYVRDLDGRMRVRPSRCQPSLLNRTRLQNHFVDTEEEGNDDDEESENVARHSLLLASAKLRQGLSRLVSELTLVFSNEVETATCLQPNPREICD